jgi:hypothetical protein
MHLAATACVLAKILLHASISDVPRHFIPRLMTWHLPAHQRLEPIIDGKRLWIAPAEQSSRRC